jgi:hypothetical protein
MKWIVPWVAAVWVGLAFGVAARADTWTNVAGHVVTAKLLAIEGGRMLLQDTNGRIRRVPLSSLKPADRERAWAQTGIEPLPADLKIPLEQAQEDINRAAQFLQGGRITHEQYAARCQTIKQRFEHFSQQALKNRGEPSDTAILERLKHRLDQLEQSAETKTTPPGKPDGNQ